MRQSAIHTGFATQEAQDPEGSKRTLMAEVAEANEKIVAQEKEAAAAAAVRKQQRAANKQARIDDGELALTAENLDEMASGHCRFGRTGNLVVRCQAMMERALAAFPSSADLDGNVVSWQKGDTKSSLTKGGGGAKAALRRLKELLADQQRPWHWGARQRLQAQPAH